MFRFYTMWPRGECSDTISRIASLSGLSGASFYLQEAAAGSRGRNLPWAPKHRHCKNNYPDPLNKPEVGLSHSILILHALGSPVEASDSVMILGIATLYFPPLPQELTLGVLLPRSLRTPALCTHARPGHQYSHPHLVGRTGDP